MTAEALLESGLDAADGRAEIRAATTAMTAAARGVDDYTVVVASMNVMALAIARMSLSPNDAVAGAKAAFGDIETQIRDVWIQLRGIDGAGNG